LHHSEDSNTSYGVTKENGDRTSISKGSADTKEETGADRSTKGDELNMTRFEAVGVSLVLLDRSKRKPDCSPSLDIAKLLGCLNIAIDVGGLSCSGALSLDNVLDPMVRRWSHCALDGVLPFLVIVGERHGDSRGGLVAV
jgi:hypothetical protein